jgi:hypothetical protein
MQQAKDDSTVTPEMTEGMRVLEEELAASLKDRTELEGILAKGIPSAAGIEADHYREDHRS